MRRGGLPRDVGLELRMAVALVLAVVLACVMVAGLALLVVLVKGGWAVALFLVFFAFEGAVRAAKHRGPELGETIGDEQRQRLEAAIERLAVIADTPPPAAEVVADPLPLSWTLALPRRRPTIRVTTGLLERLSDRELQAVIGHELGHVLHRDAVVVTLIAGPPTYFLEGVRAIRDEQSDLLGIVLLLVLGLPVLLPLLVTRIVCRHRVLAADRAAALLTGSPASVAAALLAVQDTLGGQRRYRLRRARARDVFHFVPTRESRAFARPWATHPRLERRIARLERLESQIQHERLG